MIDPSSENRVVRFGWTESRLQEIMTRLFNKLTVVTAIMFICLSCAHKPPVETVKAQIFRQVTKDKGKTIKVKNLSRIKSVEDLVIGDYVQGWNYRPITARIVYEYTEKRMGLPVLVEDRSFSLRGKVYQNYRNEWVVDVTMNEPPENVITEAIRNSMAGKKINRIDLVRVLSIGDFSAVTLSWPVKAYVEYWHLEKRMGLPQQSHRERRIYDFRIIQQKPDVWIAIPATPIFQGS